MTKARLHALFMATVATITFSAVTGAAPIAALGTWDDCNFAPVVRVAGPNVVVTIGITENFDGSLEGTYAGTEYDSVKADGGATFHGSGIFTGNVAGRYGTATYRYEGLTRSNKFHATWVLTGLSDSLASVNGHGTWTASFDGTSDECDVGLFSGTYEGSLNVGP
jgi:hypothetical protein